MQWLTVIERNNYNFMYFISGWANYKNCKNFGKNFKIIGTLDFIFYRIFFWCQDSMMGIIDFDDVRNQSNKVKIADIDKKQMVNDDESLGLFFTVRLFWTVMISWLSMIDRFLRVEPDLGGIVHWPYKLLLMFQMINFQKKIYMYLLHFKHCFETFLSLYSVIFCFGVRAISHEMVTMKNVILRYRPNILFECKFAFDLLWGVFGNWKRVISASW